MKGSRVISQHIFFKPLHSFCLNIGKDKSEVIISSPDFLSSFASKQFPPPNSKLVPILSKDGIFTFDVSLENNSLYNLEHLNRKGNISGFEYVQTSKYSESERIHTNEFEISVGDEIFKEVHKQKIYSFETYFDVIEKSPLFVSECFNAFTFEDASADSLRAQFILKKR